MVKRQNYKKLPRDEENRWVAAYQNHRNLMEHENQSVSQHVEESKRAMEVLLEANWPFIRTVALKTLECYYGRLPSCEMDREDAIQNGFFGFEQAVRRFDASRGFSLRTYAYWWVRSTVGEGLGQMMAIYHPYSALRRKDVKLQRREFDFRAIDALQVSEPSTLYQDWGIESVLQSLRPRDRQILDMWMNGMNFSEIAESFQVTRERIRQIQSKVLNTIRRKLHLGETNGLENKPRQEKRTEAG